MQSILRINLVAILFFLASNFVFSREVSPVENIDKKAKIAVKYERDKTIFSVDSIEDKHYSYQWQQSADGETWEDIEGATQPQLEATELPAKAFIRARMDDGIRIIYTLTATPIRIKGQNQVFSGCDVTWEASIPDDYKKNNPTDDEPVYQWYQWDSQWARNSWTDVGMPDKENITISFSNAAPKYKFVWCKTYDDFDKYNANNAISDDCDCIESAEKSLAKVTEYFDIDKNKTHFLLKKPNDEFDIIYNNRDTTLCAGRKIKIELSISFADQFGLSYVWLYSTDGGVTWIEDGNPSPIYESDAINESTQFKCEVLVNNCPVMLGREPTFKVNVYDIKNPQLDETNFEGLKKIKHDTREDIYYVCTQCEDSIVTLAVDSSSLDGCPFIGHHRPFGRQSPYYDNRQSYDLSYIYEMEVFKWNSTAWEFSKDYTEKLNKYDAEPEHDMSASSNYTGGYDRSAIQRSIATQGYHFYKRRFKWDNSIIQEDSIKVCIHVIDSCTWAENWDWDNNRLIDSLYTIGVTTDTIVIAKYPELEEELEEIKKDITFKYQKGTDAEKDLPIGGGLLGDCDNNMKPIGGEKVFVEFGSDAKEKLYDALKQLADLGPAYTGDTIIFTWELPEELEKDKIEKDAEDKKMLAGLMITLEKFRTEINPTSDPALNDATKKSNFENWLDRLKEDSLTFTLIDGIDCEPLDTVERKYGLNKTDITLKVKTTYCKDSASLETTLREFEQVRVVPILNCDNVSGLSSDENPYPLCANDDPILSFQADFMKSDPDNPQYRVLIQHLVPDPDDPSKWILHNQNQSFEIVNNSSGDTKDADGKGTDVWWDGKPENCKIELDPENWGVGLHKFVAIVATMECSDAITGKDDIKEYIKEGETNQGQGWSCGYFWDIDSVVFKVGEAPTAPKIAMLADGYTADIDDVNGATPKKVVIKDGSDNEVSGFGDFIAGITAYKPATATDPAEAGDEDKSLLDPSDNTIIACTYAKVQKGETPLQICFLTLEEGDSTNCSEVDNIALDKKGTLTVKQRTYTYTWERKVGNGEWAEVAGAKSYYASWEKYQNQTGVTTSDRFTGLLQPQTDENEAVVYYRLKLTDCCHEETYSNIIKIESFVSDPVKPVIGWDPTDTKAPTDKKEYEYEETDGDEVKVYYYDDTKVCSDLGKDIELVNKGEFDDKTLASDRYNFIWQMRKDEKPDNGNPDWKDDSGNEIVWADVEINGGSAVITTNDKHDPRIDKSTSTLTNLDPGYYYQYRILAFKTSDITPQKNDDGTNKTDDNGNTIQDTTFQTSNIVTIYVYKEIEKDIDEMKKDGMTIPDDNQDMSILGDTIHRKFTPAKELTLRITNPDKQGPITYKWYVGKWDASENDGAGGIKYGNDPIGDADLAQYYIAEKPDNTPTLKITQMPADCTAIFYKVVMSGGCGDIEHVFKVVANKSRTDIKQVCIGIGEEIYSTDNSTCTRDYVSNYLYNEIDKPTEPVRVCYQTELEKLCGGATLGDIIKLANHKEFNQNTIVSDKYHFVWQTRSANRKDDGSDPDWNDDDWTNITDPYESETQVDATKTKGINDTKLDYTAAPTYEAGKAYQYRLLVYTDSMAVDEKGTPLTDVKEIKNVLESNIITILVNKKIEKTTNEAEKIGCLGDKNGHTFTVKFDNVDHLECTYTWQAKKTGDADWSNIDDDNKSNYLIASVPTGANLIISNMPDNETVVYTYKVTVKSTPCNDEFSQEFTLKVASSLKIDPKGYIAFKDEQGALSGAEIEVCKNKNVTVVTQKFAIQDGSRPFNLEYYFLAKEEEVTPTDEERRQAGIIEGTSSSKDVANYTDISNTINFVANETGYIWLRLVDNCNTEQWTKPIRLVVKPLPQTPAIKCDELDNTDRIVCLNDTFSFYYDKTGINNPDNTTYTWKVKSKEEGKNYCKILKAEADEDADATYWESSDKIRIVWYSNGDNPSTVADAVFLDVYNSDTKCDNTSDKYNLNICGEKLLPTLEIIRKDTTHILIALADDEHKWFQWGYTDNQGKDYSTNWHPYHYWRYTYDDTTTLYRWEKQAWAGKIDPDNKEYWVKSLNVDDWERSYCRDRAKKSIWGKGNKTGKETKQYNYHFFVRTQSNVQNTQKIPIWIDNPKREVVHLYLISPMGVMVAQKQLPAEETIETSLPATFSSGIYFLHVQVGDERTTIKIRIQ